ncbi:MAG: hypothetical protein A2V85_06645 [Chloroflexi bacterium RBG_16_72_14]|nr:MAG: hypothetical protein A2V85_06645 [Chloroflexi bacterium RBG_16_72_14]
MTNDIQRRVSRLLLVLFCALVVTACRSSVGLQTPILQIVNESHADVMVAWTASDGRSASGTALACDAFQAVVSADRPTVTLTTLKGELTFEVRPRPGEVATWLLVSADGEVSEFAPQETPARQPPYC